jgi:hypothetical protein
MEGRGKISAEVDNVALEHTKETINNAWTHVYNMTDDEKDMLQACFPRRLVYPKGAYRDCSHPVLAALNDFANEECAVLVKRHYDKGEKTLSIGDSVRSKINASHNCILLDNSREDYRVASSACEDEDYIHHAVHARRTFKCVKGAQKCSIQAEHAFAVHSTYDITMSDVAEIFSKHGLKTMTVYMYYSTTFLRGEHSNPYSFFTVQDHPNDQTKILFGMNDDSIPYCHDRKTWRAWHETTLIESVEYNIVIEVVRSYGPLRVLRLVRTRPMDSVIYRNVPMTSIFPKCVLVPDMYSAIKRDFHISQKQLHHFVVPENVAAAIMAYAERCADEGYRFHEVATYSSGLRRRIVIGTVQFQDPWEVSVEEYHRVLISLFVLGAIARSDRTKSVSAAFKELKTSRSNGLITGFVATKMTKIFNKLHSKLSVWQRDKDLKIVNCERTIDDLGVYFSEFTIVPLKDYVIANKVSAVPTVKVNDVGYVPLPFVPTPPAPDHSWSLGLDPVPTIPNDYLNRLSDKLDFVKKCLYWLVVNKDKSVDWERRVRTQVLLSEEYSTATYYRIVPCPTFYAGGKFNPKSSIIQVKTGYRYGKVIEKTSDSSSESDSDSTSGTSDDEEEIEVNTPEIKDWKKNFIDKLRAERLAKKEKIEVAAVQSDSTVSIESVDPNSKKAEVVTLPIDGRQFTLVDSDGEECNDTPEEIKLNDEFEFTVPANVAPEEQRCTVNADDVKPIEKLDLESTKHADTVENQTGVGDASGLLGQKTDSKTRVVVKKKNVTFSSNTPLIPVPFNFLSGHCAMKCLHEIFEPQATARKFLTECLDILYDYAMVSNDVHCSRKQVRMYIQHGAYAGNDCSSLIIELYALKHSRNIHLHAGETTIEYEFGTGDVKHIWFGSQHFSTTPGAGASDKFDVILDKVKIKKKSNVLDISMAPGYMTRILRSKGHNVVAGCYKSSIKPSISKADHIYTDIAQLYQKVKHLKFDLIINDIGMPYNSERTINSANRMFSPLLKEGGMLLTKTFGNPHDLWNMDCFSDIELLELESNHTVSSERYFACTKVEIPVSRFFDYYDRPGWNRKVTQHTIPFQDNQRFINEFFVGKFKVYAPIVPKLQGCFTIEAVTGFASASKTTLATKRYPMAVFIAPSKNLALKHQSMGVSSYTQHKFFGEKHAAASHIIVDEAFQFPVDYFSVLAAAYPNHKIVVLGDVHQTPYVNFQGKRELKTLIDFGVSNNICDVYTIPQDICRALNSKHGFNMRSHSKVEESIITYTDDIDKIVGFKWPIICFNDASHEALKNKGANAHTITTYTGSRSDSVVFYIDSASVVSQLVNRYQYIYTAVSRATANLVLAGDTSYISKYYNIHGGKIMNFEEINKVYLHHDLILCENDDIVPVTVARGLATDTCTQTTASAILQSVIVPTNDPEGRALNIAKCDISPVENGRLTAPTDALMAVDVSNKCYRLQPIRFAKHQLSNNILEGVQTLVKRYGRGYNMKTDTKVPNKTLVFSELINGLCKAMYGRTDCVRKLRNDMHVPHDYVMIRQAQYMDALQKKMNVSPSAIGEIEKDFNFYNERLSFNNKRQTKFDPVVGFDESDKVGQGVAATSKPMNILLCGYARAMLDRMREILNANKRNILLATHDSEAGINDTYVSMIQQFPNVENYTCNDFSEWDSSFREAFTEVTCLLLKYMGCPEQLINDWRNFRAKWAMEYSTKFGKVVLKGTEKQFSGNPFTICENTILNMALCFTLFDYKGFKFALFKGDDSAVACDKCITTPKGDVMLKYSGHRLKLHNSPIGEFAGWFLTSKGLFPDVYRYSAKFLDKQYRDEEHFLEVQSSLQERCSAVKNQEQLNEGALICSAYYTNIFGSNRPKGELLHCTRDDAYTLFHFLRNSRNIKFSDLNMEYLPSLKY